MEQKEISTYEEMQERGQYTANGYVFDVEPVYFGEEPEYFSDVPLSFQLQNNDLSTKDLSQYIIALFQLDNKKELYKSLGLFKKAKLKLVKLFRKDYRYYSSNPSAVGLLKWLEKKIKYKGKHIKFYDLERKYKLTKSEIAEMYRYMEKLSGF